MHERFPSPSPTSFTVKFVGSNGESIHPSVVQSWVRSTVVGSAVPLAYALPHSEMNTRPSSLGVAPFTVICTVAPSVRPVDGDTPSVTLSALATPAPAPTNVTAATRAPTVPTTQALRIRITTTPDGSARAPPRTTWSHTDTVRGQAQTSRSSCAATRAPPLSCCSRTAGSLCCRLRRGPSPGGVARLWLRGCVGSLGVEMRRSAGQLVRERRQRALRTLTAAFVACGTVIAPTVGAVISTDSGQITKIPAPACIARSCGQASNTTMWAWDEQQGVTLASNLTVDITQQGNYAAPVNATGSIAAGTVVDSHYINSVRVVNSGTTVLTGTVTFPTDILGIQVNHSHLVSSDMLGAVGTDYTNGNLGSGLDFNAGDSLNFSGPRTVTVTSSEGQNFDEVRIITKHDSAPVANAGGPYTGTEGGTVTLHATASDPDSDPIVTSWSFQTTASRPGTVCTPGATNTLSPTISCNDDAVVTATLSVTDPFHPAVTSSAQITIGNAAPVVGTLTAPTGQIPLATTVNISAPFTDAGTNDTHTATVDWGDTTSSDATITETNGSGTLTASHQYSTPGLYTATVTLHDDDSGLTTASAVLQMNGPPVANAGGPYSTPEGTAAQLTGTASDPEHDPISVGWNITPTAEDQGTTCNTTGTSTLTPTVTCNDDAVLGATITANDGINPPVTAQTTVTVLNAPPVLDTPSITSGPVSTGDNVHVGATFTDPSTNDTHTATVNWGDVTTSNAAVTETNGSGSIAADHSYSHAGLYTVTITLTDDNGGTSVKSTQVLVNTPPTVSAGGPYVGFRGLTTAAPGHGQRRRRRHAHVLVDLHRRRRQLAALHADRRGYAPGRADDRVRRRRDGERHGDGQRRRERAGAQ